MKEDLEHYLKCLAVKRGCPVDSLDRSKAHWNLIMNRKACMEEIRAYKGDKLYSCSLCGKRFADRCNRNRHCRKVKCTDKVVRVDVFKCKICQKQFSTRTSRDRHGRTMHKKGSIVLQQADSARKQNTNKLTRDNWKNI